MNDVAQIGRAARHGVLRVLIVEDCADDATLLVHQLAAQGVRIVPTTVDTEAQYLAALDTLPDVILCDYRLPQFDGLRALEWMQQRGLDIPFILVSGTIGEDRAAEAMQRGAYDYLLKDRLGRLGLAIERALERKRLAVERREAERELCESEKRFRQITENIGEIFWLADSCGRRTLYVSPAYERIWGRSAQEALSTPWPWLEAVHPHDRDRIAAALECDFGHGRYDERYRIVRPDGAIHWIHDRAFPVNDGNEAVYRIAGIAEDITERVAAEDRQAMAEKANVQLAAIVRAADDAIISCSPEGTLLTWNTAAEKLFGYTAHEAIGRPGTIVFPENEKPRFEALVRGVIGSPDTARRYEAVRCTKAGKPVDVSITAFPVFSDGACISLGIIYHDITNRKRLQREAEERTAQLRASQEKLESILGSLREVVYSCDYETCAPTYLNAAVEAITGYRTCDFRARPSLWLDIVHPADRAAVREALALLKRQGTNSSEYRVVRRDGEMRVVQNSAQVIRDRDGVPLRIEGVVVDVTERKLAEQRADRLARFDALTDLPNRALFQDRLELAMARARRRGEALGVMVLNLDRFKKVNDSLGIANGDRLLREVAVRLRRTLRDGDTIARLGGNDFAVLVEGLSESEDVLAIGRKLIDTLAAPFKVDGREVFVSAGVGIARYPNGTSEPQGLLQDAEIAMRRVKADGGNDCQLYQEARAPHRFKQLELETGLRHALERGELEVRFQPKVDLLSGAIVGAEALLRWDNPELGTVSPSQFIPLAEETGLIIPIGDWALRYACAQFQKLVAAGYEVDVAVNLSPRQFRQKDLVQAVAAALSASGLDARHLILEITEGTAMSRAEHAVTVLNALHDLGVKLAVDDFGTGYSSLGYLKRFPLHSLKIDRSFIVDIGNDRPSETIVPATVGLAHGLQLKAVAEGVETAQQRDFLVASGCDEAQGFLYGGALRADAFEALLRGSLPRLAS